MLPLVVQAPARPPLPYGLFSQLTFTEGGAERWLPAGVIVDGLPCARPPVLDADMCADGVEYTLDHLFPDGGPVDPTVWAPFTIYAIDVCTPIASDPPGKASAHFYNIEQTQAESALWAHLEALTDPIVSGGTPKSGLDALSTLERSMGRTLSGLGVLHVGRELATRLLAEKLMESKGSQMLTRLGTPVVVGAGYSNDRIILTAPLIGFRGPVEDSFLAPELFDSTLNNQFGLTTRDYLIAFESCGISAALVNPPSSTPQ